MGKGTVCICEMTVCDFMTHAQYYKVELDMMRRVV